MVSRSADMCLPLCRNKKNIARSKRLGVSTGFRARQRLRTQRRDLKCGIRAQETGRQTEGLELLSRSFNFLCAIHGARRDGDVWRCAVPPSTFGTVSVVWSIAETVGLIVRPVGNLQIEVLLAEGNLIDGLHAVATAPRPTVGSLSSILEAAFNAPAASGIQCVLDF